MKQTIKELAAQWTQHDDVRGSAMSSQYSLAPTQWLKEIVDAAQAQFFFANFVKTIHAPAGVHDVIIPKRTNYLALAGSGFDATVGDMQFDQTERGASDITFTEIDNLSTTTVTPVVQLAGISISNFAIRSNAINLVEAAKSELTYAVGEKVDRAIAGAIGDATDAESTVANMQILYGGDANSDASGQLATGDVITTDLVAKAKRYLQSKVNHYRASTGTGAESTTTTYPKNPWLNTADDPFVLFIGPAQEETFLKDSQFVNAAEYGSNVVIQNGEIGSYLGIKIVVTNNVEQVASGGTGVASGSATGTDSTACILMKAKKACALVYGRDPALKVYDYPNRDQTRVTMVFDYAIGILHADAIVGIIVSDS